MRRLLFFSLALLPLTLTLPALAAPPDPPPPIINATVYAEALSSLRHTHDFARCAQQLKYLVVRDDSNRDYHLALGCAEADRAISLGYAALFTQAADDERTKALHDLQAHRAEIPADLYDRALAQLPPLRTFVTKDDSHPFLLTPAQATAQINTLTADARAQWTRALALSPTPEAHAEAEYVQGWGLQMLRLLANNNLNGLSGNNASPPPKPALAVPDSEEPLRAFLNAAKDAPQNAVYWQSLGDAQYSLTKGDENIGRADALVSYNKSLALQPVNAALWYRVYQMTSSIKTNDPMADKQNAQSALKHVVDSDPGNAYPRYLLAGLLFKQTYFSDPHDKSEKADQEAALTATYNAAQQAIADSALAQIETANTCPRYGTVDYQPPYPVLLTGFDVWANLLRISLENWGDYAKLRELARACGGYARIAAAQGDAIGLQRGARACVGMGMKMTGDWPAQEKMINDGTIINVLVGAAVVGIGYSDLVKGEQQLGDVPGAQNAQAEYDAFKQRQAEYKTQVQATIDGFSIYDYY